MAAALGQAVQQGRVLVARTYDRAQHAGCEGDANAQWHCYFLPETSDECRSTFFPQASERAVRVACQLYGEKLLGGTSDSSQGHTLSGPHPHGATPSRGHTLYSRGVERVKELSELPSSYTGPDPLIVTGRRVTDAPLEEWGQGDGDEGDADVAIAENLTNQTPGVDSSTNEGPEEAKPGRPGLQQSSTALNPSSSHSMLSCPAFPRILPLPHPHNHPPILPPHSLVPPRSPVSLVLTFPSSSRFPRPHVSLVLTFPSSPFPSSSRFPRPRFPRPHVSLVPVSLVLTFPSSPFPSSSRFPRPHFPRPHVSLVLTFPSSSRFPRPRVSLVPVSLVLTFPSSSRFPRPHVSLVLTFPSSSRFPRPHVSLVLTFPSSSRFSRPHVSLVLTFPSSSRFSRPHVSLVLAFLSSPFPSSSRFPRPHVSLVLTFLSSSRFPRPRFPRPHVSLVLTFPSSSRFPRPHVSLVLTFPSSSRFPRPRFPRPHVSLVLTFPSSPFPSSSRFPRPRFPRPHVSLIPVSLVLTFPSSPFPSSSRFPRPRFPRPHVSLVLTFPSSSRFPRPHVSLVPVSLVLTFPSSSRFPRPRFPRPHVSLVPVSLVLTFPSSPFPSSSRFPRPRFPRPHVSLVPVSLVLTFPSSPFPSSPLPSCPCTPSESRAPVLVGPLPCSTLTPSPLATPPSPQAEAPVLAGLGAPTPPTSPLFSFRKSPFPPPSQPEAPVLAGPGATTPQPPPVSPRPPLYSPPRLKHLWWRAQALRFLLRAPSPYLCHVSNVIRHDAFGPMAARVAALGEAAVAQADVAGEGWRDCMRKEYECVATLCAASHSHSPTSPADAPSSIQGTSGSMESDLWRRHVAVWVPRPLVGVHVRSAGQGGAEAGVCRTMGALVAVRQQLPAARFVWLNSDEQEVRGG
ncbi:unnamed protein product [Closterium sp. Yama58-4]|nr:unnamed protein product [Closterium sp. Yama58-4]